MDVRQTEEQIRIICGDAAEEMSRIPEKCVQLITADPPYNLNKDYWNNQDKLTSADRKKRGRDRDQSGLCKDDKETPCGKVCRV